MILDVRRLKEILKHAADDAEIIIRTRCGDTHVLMDELEVYAADSSHPRALEQREYQGVETLIIDLSDLGETFTVAADFEID